MLQRPFAPFQRLFWTMKLPPHNHRALKVFESTKVSPQCFYFLQVFHSSKQQKIGLSNLHGVPCTNLGRDFFIGRPFFCCAQRLVVFEVSEPLSEAHKPCASILSESGLSSHLKHSDGGAQDLRGKKIRNYMELHWRNACIHTNLLS